MSYHNYGLVRFSVFLNTTLGLFCIGIRVNLFTFMQFSQIPQSAFKDAHRMALNGRIGLTITPAELVHVRQSRMSDEKRLIFVSHVTFPWAASAWARCQRNVSGTGDPRPWWPSHEFQVPSKPILWIYPKTEVNVNTIYAQNLNAREY